MPSAEHPLDAAMEELKSDKPRITDAAKNLVAMLAAADLARGLGREDEQPHEIASLLAIAKVVLQCVNNYVPPTPDVWAAAHPQGDDEKGSDRIETLTHYRAAHALHSQATAAGAKPTKLLGRSYLRATRCTDDVAARVRAECADGTRFPAHTVSSFLDGWTQSVSAEDDDSALVWAADFNAALQARREARAKEAAERADRMKEGDSEAERLRSALAAEKAMAEGEAGEEEEDEDDEEEAPRVIEVDVGEAAFSQAGIKPPSAV